VAVTTTGAIPICHSESASAAVSAPDERRHVAPRERLRRRIRHLIAHEVAAGAGDICQILRLGEDREPPGLEPAARHRVVGARPEQGVGGLVDRVGVVGGHPLWHPRQIGLDAEARRVPEHIRATRKTTTIHHDCVGRSTSRAAHPAATLI
jgi:hypothetical protein